ncbi:hypothetical protein HN604_01735 [archaeon]|jgi:hypothetical protein|nr:hypothetical protein [archaeon]MBT6182974.1 hypothetical protein [archaeon]MBT6606561.1 hypothetical protein [archaeon]MBT7251812.1 hypothetical protein [archaeon]MBT7660783.1 hypothetical protein [archaeon]
MNKKADYKWGLLLNLIIGLIILGISLYFIFTEFVIEEDINYEVCRQSVILRQQAIDKGGGFAAEMGKEIAEEFPFKCQASHKIIDYKDYDRAGIQIMDAMASCHALYGKGEYELYASNWFDEDLMCFQCYRISFAPEVNDYYSPLSYSSNSKVSEIENQINIHLDEIESIYPGGTNKILRDWFKLINLQKNQIEFSIEWNNTNEEIIAIGILREEINSIELKVTSLDSEIAKLQLHEIGTGNQIFHWKNYLFKTMRGTNMTYAEFIYGFDEEQKAKLSKTELGLLTSIEYSSEFDYRDGDIIITYAHSKQNIIIPFIAEKHWGSTVLTYQTNQNPSCNVYETIPA